MPIVFQQPEPIRGDISTGYGAAQQFSQDLPALVHQQQAIAQGYQQAAALRQRAVQASQELQQRGFEHANALGQRSYEAGLHYDLAQQQMVHQSDMQAQHAQLQESLMNSQLSRGEQMRLQRLQEAKGLIQARIDSGEYTPQDGNDLMMQVMTQINPYQQRQAKAQQQHAELQNQMMQRQIAQFDHLQNQRDEYANSTAQSHVEVVTDPETGEQYTFHRDENGKRTFLGARGGASAVWEPGQQIGPGGTSGTRTRGAGGGAEGGVDGGFNRDLHRAAMDEAKLLAGVNAETGKQNPVSEETVQRIYDRMAGMGQRQEPQVTRQMLRQQAWRDIGQAFPNMPQAQRHRLADAEADRRMAEQASNSPAAQEAARRAEAERIHADTRVRVGEQDLRPRIISQTMERLRREGWRPPTQQGARTPEGFPILNPDGTQTRSEGGGGGLPERQAARFETARTTIDQLPEDRREHLRGVVGRAERMLAQARGNPEDMSPSDRRIYNGLIDVINNIRLEEARREQPAAPRPATLSDVAATAPRTISRFIGGNVNAGLRALDYRRPAPDTPLPPLFPE